MFSKRMDMFYTEKVEIFNGFFITVNLNTFKKIKIEGGHFPHFYSYHSQDSVHSVPWTDRAMPPDYLRGIRCEL